MKDPARAKAAGLVKPRREVLPDLHKRGWQDDQLKKAHAHKAG